jgi:hypothetical protein
MVIVGALLTVVGIQAAAIAALLVYRARRMRAESALRASERRFRRFSLDQVLGRLTAASTSGV